MTVATGRPRPNGGAMELANTIDAMLNNGIGPMNIPVDDIVEALYHAYVMPTHDAANKFIERHLYTALDILADRGWSCVKTTQYWRDLGYTVPGTEPEIKRCVAGIGRLPGGAASKGVGLHFTALETDDWLWVYARDHGAKVWRGKRHKEIVRLTDELDAGRLTPSGIAIAERSALDPEIGDKPYRKDIKQITS